ncbi:MAG: MBL fold metallo-hydrolase [Candidatus Omnitrophica bacterium]|nr:MBL fold metallo-hydrolase [Candidatus Omnitrophota bacterium]
MDKTIVLRTVVVGALQANCYIVADKHTRAAIVVDPGADGRKIKAVLLKEGLRETAVVLTHGHFDHIGAVPEFTVPVYVHQADAEMLTDSRMNMSGLFGAQQSVNCPVRFLGHNDTLEIGGMTAVIKHTPGHTAGGICLLIDGIVLSGDTLFCGGIGRTDLPGGSYKALIDSIKKHLLVLDDAVKVFPGHGMPTTIGDEKKGNERLWE